MISLLGPTVERRKHKAIEFRLRISFPNFEPKVYTNINSLLIMVNLSVLSCFIQQCVYIRFACRSECGHSNPVLRAETLVVHCQDDGSTPLITRTFRGHLDWPLICHVVNYPLKEMFDVLNKTYETTDGVYHCILAACGISKLSPWPVITGKTSLKPFVPIFSKIFQIWPATLEK